MLGEIRHRIRLAVGALQGRLVQVTDPTDEIVERYGVNPQFCNHVPKGWAAIVSDALARMRKADPDVDISQVKEKFAGLRIYYDPVTPELDAIVDEAEEQCARACEECGTCKLDAGVHARGKGWIRTLCDRCAR